MPPSVQRSRTAGVLNRRTLLKAGSVLFGAPAIVRAQRPLTLRFATIKDPDGWHPSLRLKGDWLVFEVSDGIVSGFGEASHSRDDAACQAAARQIFDRYYADASVSLESLRQFEADIGAMSPAFVEATAFSGINQALYDLLAKREQVPVWQLFRDRVAVDSVPLYTTINRALKTRTLEEYLGMAEAADARGFAALKCAPFEAVASPDLGLSRSGPGLERLLSLRSRFPALGLRVDFHERFRPEDFLTLVPGLEALGLDWLEEPFAMGPDYSVLKRSTALRVAGGELFWGLERFESIAANAWVDVIMPDVKHVGGFGPLLDVIAATKSRVEISPHNPSGPISTAASLHAAVLNPDAVRSIEYAFDRDQTRPATGERVESGRLFLSEQAGWGVQPP